MFPTLYLPMACDATWGEGGTRRFPWTRGGLVQGQRLDREWRPVAPCHRDGSAVAQEGPPVAGEYADPEDL